MKKLLSIVLAAALVFSLAAVSGCSEKQETLTLYTWEGMFPQEILDGFEKDTGIRINYVNFDYDETMLAKLQAANGGDYDLVIADDYIIETVIAEGLAQKLDLSKLPSYDGINPVYQGQFYDPTNEYTVPYGAGVQTIVYDPEAVGFEINGYADLWNEQLADSLGIIANYRVINGMALKVLGESYNTEDLETIDAAGDLLADLAPNIRLIKDDYLEDDLLSGEINAAIMYTSQVTGAKMARPSLEIVYPEEGIGFGIMAGFIPSNAPNPDAAHQFLEYILDPERAADCFEYLGYYCTTLAAEQYISEEYRSFLTIPAEFADTEMEMIENISAEADSEHALVWSEFKTLCGQ